MALRGAALVALATGCGLASRLHRLDEPPTPVFDEYHVGRFVIWIDESMDSFDLHPPLLKMVYQAVSRGLGHGGRASCSYGAADPFVADHTVPYDTCSMWEMRLTAAACGGLLAPTFLLSAALLGVRWPAALLGTLLLLCDNMFFGLARLHMLDMGTVLLVGLIILVAITTQRASERYGPGAALPSLLLALNGVLLGLALASKFAMALPTIAWLGLQSIAALRRHAHAAARSTGQRRLVATVDDDSKEDDDDKEDDDAAAALCWLAADAIIRAVALLGGAALTYLGVMWYHFSRVPMRHWKSEHYTLAAPPYDDHVPCVATATLKSSYATAPLVEALTRGLVCVCIASSCSHCVPPLAGAAAHATFWQRLDDYTRNQWSYDSVGTTNAWHARRARNRDFAILPREA